MFLSCASVPFSRRALAVIGRGQGQTLSTPAQLVAPTQAAGTDTSYLTLPTSQYPREGTGTDTFPRWAHFLPRLSSAMPV